MGLQQLARLCYSKLQQPVGAHVSPNMALPGLTTMQPPIPVQALVIPPRNEKERLQQMARSTTL